MSNQTTPNVELLTNVLDYIKEHPDEWEQKNWITSFECDSKANYERVGVPVPACGTAFCFAGHALALNSIEIKVDNNTYIYSSDYHENGERDVYAMVGTGYYAVNGNPVSDVAAEILGLGPKQASVLFMAYNRLEDLEHIVEQIISGEIPYDFDYGDDDDYYGEEIDTRDAD